MTDQRPKAPDALPEDPRDVQRRVQAERDIQRATDESGLIGTGFLGRAKHHFSASDTDPDDPIERLGKKIGRWAALILFIGLAIYLWRTYLA
ncbi:MAG: hypothetical protein AAFX39_13000 [Pseudomonadota bacterium]